MPHSDFFAYLLPLIFLAVCWLLFYCGPRTVLSKLKAAVHKFAASGSNSNIKSSLPFLMIFGVAAALVLCAYGVQVLDDRNKQHQWNEIHHALAESHGWDERSLDSQQETQLETDTDDLCEKLSVGPRGD